ncbi:hypothetical protein HK414_18660 [Ramlibacter terrae]|uniref:GGDEF domain-containing protein n=1 Tax=Ramlibacter terrae TaxID=2732511 RepID=A0ABX6P427_9BURK|nr:hypothetical protein HK414_18660 [Ramlibacter terrae]
MNGSIDLRALWLGAFVGAQVLVVFFCVIKANAYRERALLLHAAATLLSVLTVQSLIGRQPMVLPGAVFLLVPALAGLQLLDLMSHAGALRRARRWLLGTSAVAMPVLAVGAAFHPVFPGRGAARPGAGGRPHPGARGARASPGSGGWPRPCWRCWRQARASPCRVSATTSTWRCWSAAC